MKLNLLHGLAAVCLAANAQTVMTLPETSQRAMVGQRIGLTDIAITYHRPLVNGRKVWGGLVPYDQVWRAGANENTTIEFSTAVKVEGRPLAKGIYGLHMIPGTDSWTVIFSRNSSAWGSFTYQQDEDALRVTVKPQTGEMHEALTYDFDGVKPGSTTVKLQWEKLAVPFEVSADETEVTLASLRDELRGGKQYAWEGFAEAGNYCLANKVALDQGLEWTNKSIQAEERFENVMLKSQLLKAMNKSTESAAAREKALSIGAAQQVYSFGRQLLFQNQPAEAMDIFRLTVKRFPDHWVGHVAAARLAVASGDYTAALKELKIVQSSEVNEQLKTSVANLIRRLENKEDINK